MSYVIANLPFFLLLLIPIVFFHELGHFAAAKLCGVRVLRFSIGFGPRLIGFKYGETEYALSAIPLGGYVKMWGENPLQDTIAEENRQGSFMHQPAYKRALIVVAGPVANFILAWTIYAALFQGKVDDRLSALLGASNTPARVGYVFANAPAGQAGMKPQDKILSVNGEAMRDWLHFQKTMFKQGGAPMQIEIERAGATRAINVTPLIEDDTDELGQSIKRAHIGVSPIMLSPIVDVPEADSPAALAGLRTGDEVLEINQTPISAYEDIVSMLAQHPTTPLQLKVRRLDPIAQGEAQKGAETIFSAQFLMSPANALPHKIDLAAEAHIRPDPLGFYSGLSSMEALLTEIESDTPASKAGLKVGDRVLQINGRDVHMIETFSNRNKEEVARQTLRFTISRGGAIHTLAVRPEERTVKDALNERHVEYILGAFISPSVTRMPSVTRHYSLREALRLAYEKVAHVSWTSLRGMGRLATGGIPLSQVSGVMTIFKVAEHSAKRGAADFLNTMGIISISIGLLNLLPIPVLDGGHLAMIAVETIQRRPPTLKTQERAIRIGFVILGLLMLLAFHNDIIRFFFN